MIPCCVTRSDTATGGSTLTTRSSGGPDDERLLLELSALCPAVPRGSANNSVGIEHDAGCFHGVAASDRSCRRCHHRREGGWTVSDDDRLEKRLDAIGSRRLHLHDEDLEANEDNRFECHRPNIRVYA